MAGLLTRLLNLLTDHELLVRGLVLLSLTAHILLIPLAGIRRRKASGLRRSFLWLLYQLADWAATYTIGKLFLGSPSREQQLVAFWFPFLLMHLGRPDNINAYTLEDNKLSARQALDAFKQVGGAVYALYKHIIVGGVGGTFLAASVIMFCVGITKYLERVLALWKADLGSIRSSGKSRRARSPPRVSKSICYSEQVLLVAHDLFRITEGAFADYSSVKGDPLNTTRTDRWPHGWEKMYKVVQMELSIMYDVLYTKAKKIHTWLGYVFRAAWPFFTLTAFLLFWFCNKDGLRRPDIYITYSLFAATFLLDMGWLLRALVSAGTYAFLKDRTGLRHQVVCTRRWHWLRRVVVSDLVKEPTSCRMWSGRIGQYNLFHECTHETTSLLRTPAKYFGLEDSWKDYQYHYSRGLDIPPCVRKLLFDRIWEKLKLAYGVRVPSPLPPSARGYAARGYKEPLDADLKRRNKLDNALGFDPELHVNILVFHIATDVFLWCSRQKAASCTHVKAIKALSDYMMFLVAVRPDMLPGLNLSSLHEATRDALQGIWNVEGKKKCNPRSEKEQKLACILQQMEQPDLGKKRSRLYDKSVILSDGTRFAKVLLGRLRNEDVRKICKEVGIGDNHSSSEDAYDKVIGDNHSCSEDAYDKVGIGDNHSSSEDACDKDGIGDNHSSSEDAYEKLLCTLISVLWSDDNAKINVLIMKIILDAWVRMLIYVSIRCSRESHAKQLSRGGELTTIVWILAEHAGVFGIAEPTEDPTDPDPCSVM